MNFVRVCRRGRTLRSGSFYPGMCKVRTPPTLVHYGALNVFFLAEKYFERDPFDSQKYLLGIA
jgi:hypothetical protein